MYECIYLCGCSGRVSKVSDCYSRENVYEVLSVKVEAIEEAPEQLYVRTKYTCNRYSAKHPTSNPLLFSIDKSKTVRGQ